jgi:hypothetical protein
MTKRNHHHDGKANIDWITDDLAAGGDFSYRDDIAARQLQDLLDQGVGCVIDCRIEADDFAIWTEVDGVTYHWLPVNDIAGSHLPRAHFDRAVAIARQAQREGRKMLAHCHMGVNRGPSTAFAILLDRGMDPIEAFDLIRERRPRAAIAYAEDALAAHLLRETGQLDYDVLNTFVEHVEAVMTDRVHQGIQHIMRQHHQSDQLERLG